jgi:hypothetical protein
LHLPPKAPELALPNTSADVVRRPRPWRRRAFLAVVLPGAKADAFRRAAIHAAFLMGRDPRKTGFFAFVQFRQLPLQWALPRRFETIP